MSQRASGQRWAVAAVVVGCVVSAGCALALVGAGALGGYAISKDTIQGNTDKPFESVWQASLAAVSEMGAVTGQDRETGLMVGEVHKSDVRVTVEQLTERSVQLSVKCRRNLLPNLSLAEKIFVKILRTAR
jgi:hypothetical protein